MMKISGSRPALLLPLCSNSNSSSACVTLTRNRVARYRLHNLDARGESTEIRHVYLNRGPTPGTPGPAGQRGRRGGECAFVRPVDFSPSTSVDKFAKLARASSCSADAACAERSIDETEAGVRRRGHHNRRSRSSEAFVLPFHLACAVCRNPRNEIRADDCSRSITRGITRIEQLPIASIAICCVPCGSPLMKRGR